MQKEILKSLRPEQNRPRQRQAVDEAEAEAKAEAGADCCYQWQPLFRVLLFFLLLPVCTCYVYVCVY